MKRTLDTIITALLFTVGAIVLCSFAVRYFQQRSERLNAGDRITALRGVDYSSHEKTLLLLLRRGCQYCDDSLPFYGKLEAAASRSGCAVIALVREQPRAELDLFRSKGIKIPVVGNIPFDALKVTATPTLVLVDRRGTVQGVWTGQLRPDGEREVLALVDSPLKRASR